MTSVSTGSATSRHQRRLAHVFILTCTYLVAEVVGGVLTGSLALLADAGHMLTDVAGLGLALLAIKIGERPTNPTRTYGYYRTEILAAVANAIVLIGVSLYVLYEAYRRVREPPEVASVPMMIIAGVGLIVNVIGILLLRSSATESLNMKGAYFEVLSDALTSIGVIVAALVMLLTRWFYADPLISAGIGLLILPRTWSLLRDAINVLLEGVPRDVNPVALRSAIHSVKGVAAVHDLHIWSVTSGMNAMSVHVVLRAGARHDVLRATRDAILSGFRVSHVTVQVEPEGFLETEPHL